MRCPNCGQEVMGTGAARCPQCGAALPPTLADAAPASGVMPAPLSGPAGASLGTPDQILLAASPPPGSVSMPPPPPLPMSPMPAPPDPGLRRRVVLVITFFVNQTQVGTANYLLGPSSGGVGLFSENGAHVVFSNFVVARVG